MDLLANTFCTHLSDSLSGFREDYRRLGEVWESQGVSVGVLLLKWPLLHLIATRYMSSCHTQFRGEKSTGLWHFALTHSKKYHKGWPDRASAGLCRNFAGCLACSVSWCVPFLKSHSLWSLASILGSNGVVPHECKEVQVWIFCKRKQKTMQQCKWNCISSDCLALWKQRHQRLFPHRAFVLQFLTV